MLKNAHYNHYLKKEIRMTGINLIVSHVSKQKSNITTTCQLHSLINLKLFIKDLDVCLECETNHPKSSVK